jgi:hypothetical protein
MKKTRLNKKQNELVEKFKRKGAPSGTKNLTTPNKKKNITGR